MTSPNKPSKSDILAAREIAMAKLPPSFRKAIDAGELDPWGLVQTALAELIRKREGEGESE
jgi:hypothetical protein